MSDFERFSDFIQHADLSQGIPQELLLRQSGGLQTYYAPFDFVNESAQIIICGITPGLQQAMLALNEAKRQLSSGASIAEASRAAKNTASFGGPMRSNLIRMLDYIGIPKYLGIASASSLFAEANGLVHYTSALRYPVFAGGKNYNGSPRMTKHPDLLWQLNEHLSEEIGILSTAIIVPLGPKVEEGFTHLLASGTVREDQILGGLPHPSGANAERIAFFLDQKRASELSSKTNPEKILRARETLLEKVGRLGV